MVFVTVECIAILIGPTGFNILMVLLIEVVILKVITTFVLDHLVFITCIMLAGDLGKTGTDDLTFIEN
jgi:hypothetical protein